MIILIVSILFQLVLKRQFEIVRRSDKIDFKKSTISNIWEIKKNRYIKIKYHILPWIDFIQEMIANQRNNFKILHIIISKFSKNAQEHSE
jgi:hypothetical protein